MSNYRDDTMETAVASSQIWLGVKSLLVESAKASAIATMTLGFLITDQVQASDTEYGARGITIIEEAKVSENFYLKNEAIQYIQENAALKDLTFYRTIDTIIESATAQDLDLSKTSSVVHERAIAQDSDLSHRTAYQVLYNTAFLNDQAFAYTFHEVFETATFYETQFSHLAAHSLVLESAQFDDSELSSYSSAQFISEKAQASDQVFGTLQAFTLTKDTAYAEDEILLNTLSAQAWVSHSKTWAMSRYSPFNFEGLAVINGKIHLYNDQGVYVMDGEDEIISATIETGALDFSEQLTHPISAYLEYQLSGQEKSLDIQVSTTQSGNLQKYQYYMPKEQADYLTNGRVLFGRGLRGRHFGFKINIKAQSAQINALSIEHIQTRRRV